MVRIITRWIDKPTLQTKGKNAISLHSSLFSGGANAGSPFLCPKGLHVRLIIEPLPESEFVMERIPLTKKQRFNVFKRDAFACQYCGATPPSVVLEVDHIHPVSLGGKNSIDNLITACFDCNRGKSAGLLTSLPDSVVDKAALMQEKLEQIKAFGRLIKSKRKHEDKQINEVQDAFNMHWEGFSFSPKFRESIRLFLNKLPSDVVINYMHLACNRIQRRDDSIKYFCGICWKTIKAAQNG